MPARATTNMNHAPARDIPLYQRSYSIRLWRVSTRSAFNSLVDLFSSVTVVLTVATVDDIPATRSEVVLADALVLAIVLETVSASCWTAATWPPTTLKSALVFPCIAAISTLPAASMSLAACTAMASRAASFARRVKPSEVLQSSTSLSLALTFLSSNLTSSNWARHVLASGGVLLPEKTRPTRPATSSAPSMSSTATPSRFQNSGCSFQRGLLSRPSRSFSPKLALSATRVATLTNPFPNPVSSPFMYKRKIRATSSQFLT